MDLPLSNLPIFIYSFFGVFIAFVAIVKVVSHSIDFFASES